MALPGPRSGAPPYRRSSIHLDVAGFPLLSSLGQRHGLGICVCPSVTSRILLRSALLRFSITSQFCFGDGSGQSLAHSLRFLLASEIRTITLLFFSFVSRMLGAFSCGPERV